MHPLVIVFLGIAVVVAGVLVFRLHAFLALTLAAFVVATATPKETLLEYGRKKNPAEAEKFAASLPAERVAREFGVTCGRIGLLIGFASIIGVCLLESGAAQTIVGSSMRALGQGGAPYAFLISGFLLGIPIFFESVFLLMIPLAKAAWLHTRKNYLLYVMSIIAGGTMTHSLVPPTPGPLFVAAALKVDLGVMMLGGCIVSAICGCVGFLYARWLDIKMPIPVRDMAETSVERKNLPPLWLSLLPIVLPVVMIGGRSFVDVETSTPQALWVRIVDQLGEPNIALAISAAIALAILVKRVGDISKKVQAGLEDGGLIILIIGAGGAFGGMLQQTGVSTIIEQFSQNFKMGVLPLAFLVTMLIRIAQGSATVAMITAVGIVGGLATSAQLGFHPVYLALAIGCGSKPGPWMNDSGFWVICKLSGMTEGETLKSFSGIVTIMGFVGLGVVMIAAKVFPMV